VNLLLDTHAFLWYVLADPRLKEAARGAIDDIGNGVWISPVSYWEMAIKVSMGKYRLRREFQEFFEYNLAVNRFDLLPIDIQHAAELSRLPFHHRDPFDRMLAAQAIVEGATLVSSDRAFDEYSLSRLW